MWIILGVWKVIVKFITWENMMKYVFFLICIVSLMLSACEKSTKALEPVAAPSFTPLAGTYYSTQSVHINCSTNDATIRYTLDGTVPNQNSQIYSNPIGIAENTVIKAIAYKSKMKASAVSTAAYNFDVANLYIAPIGGTFSTPQTVLIASSTTGTIIHYTTDGTEPNESSPIYSAPLTIDGYTILKAKGYVAGWTPSETITAIYVFNVTQPTFDMEDGVYYNPFELSINTPTNGATIRYTTNNTEPTETSEIYSIPVNITTSAVIKAKAYKANWNTSNTSSVSVELKVTSPQFFPLPGTYYQPQAIAVSTTTPGADIHYTTDGSDPATDDNTYASPITLSTITTLKARAFKTGWTPSNISQGSYIFNVYAPTFDPPAGQFTEEQTVTMSCATPAAEIRYTVNGSDPTLTSSLYTAPLSVPSTATIKAKAYKTGMNASQITTATYTINPIQTVAAPTFNPPGGNYNSIQSVAISCATSGTSIRYTTDNSEPSQSSLLYSTPVTIATATTLKAKAYKTGWNESQTASDDYTVSFNSVQMINIPSGTFDMGRTSGTGEADELPVHSITLSAYSIGKYEIIQADWMAVMGNNPSFFAGDLYRPVENVNWYSILVYCNKRSINEGLAPVYTIAGSTNPDDWGTSPTTFTPVWNAAICNFSANGYRLPTEAEWEYAARGASNTPDYAYSGTNNLVEAAWYQLNADGATHPVGQLLENGLGICDMSGNVREWCWDWYDSSYYTSSPANNPTGPGSSSYKVIRGGCWEDFVTNYCRVVSRDAIVPYPIVNKNGFRVVRTTN
jgi:formylglycine-generating enzyme required for sulfatase activity